MALSREPWRRSFQNLVTWWRATRKDRKFRSTGNFAHFARAWLWSFSSHKESVKSAASSSVLGSEKSTLSALSSVKSDGTLVTDITTASERSSATQMTSTTTADSIIRPVGKSTEKMDENWIKTEPVKTLYFLFFIGHCDHDSIQLSYTIINFLFQITALNKGFSGVFKTKFWILDVDGLKEWHVTTAKRKKVHSNAPPAIEQDIALGRIRVCSTATKTCTTKEEC